MCVRACVRACVSVYVSMCLSVYISIYIYQQHSIRIPILLAASVHTLISPKYNIRLERLHAGYLTPDGNQTIAHNVAWVLVAQ